MVLEKVTEIIVNTTNCNADDVHLDSALASLGVDSLKAITVIFELEEAFDIEVPNEAISSMVTVNDIVDKLHEIRH